MDISDSQNFLNDKWLVLELIKKSSINKNDIVLDIGAGEGIISLILSDLCKKVIAIELDNNLFIKLKKKFEKIINIEIINRDFLSSSLPDLDYKVFSNIPFNQTSSIINKLFFSQNPPQDSYLIIQKEAALRFMGEGEGTLVSLLLKPFFNLSILYNFKRTDFTPPPSVDIVLLRIQKLQCPLISQDELQLYKNFMSFIILQQSSSLKKRVRRLFMPAEFYSICKILNLNPKGTIKKIAFEQWLGLFKYFLSLKNQKTFNNKIKLIQNSFKKYLSIKDNQPKVRKTRFKR
ncbi:hypothetical protein A2V49_04615 [candidate division WWE3 bacterium RBG_19FT_COMBO_34_6]|uniref:Ribosomal RNA adenine methylase transferase N-terminal domain-containing protein n=1 Tax=candidate division WWE3 bacterium RBG_19FT_COMBO_34_6 TaxID=1802612 RepID=A0A1F4UMU9_UNCKA|nr:MAG: hypothetical protein A2V49_04615 [candidate division WWE3 bacterium RBG_19FT_COMBO_34_6]